MKTQRPITTTALYLCGSLTALFAALAFGVSAPSASVDDCDIHVKAGQDWDITTDTTVNCVHVEATGRLLIWNATLTLTSRGNHTTSIVDGKILLELSNSELHFKKRDHTLVGSGLIKGKSSTARISCAPERTLTSEITIEGALQIRAGSGTFTNSGLVHSNRRSTPWTLTLYSGTFDGAGEYKVSENSSAVLNARAGVTATGLSGPFTVSAGTLDINENVTTTGNLTQTGGTIDVAPGKTFTAG